jgi:hypothetical protein
MIQYVALIKRINILCPVSVQNTFNFWYKIEFKINKELLYGGGLPAYLMERDLGSTSQS